MVGLLGAFAACICLAPTAKAVLTDPAFVETGYGTKLRHVTSMAWAPDGTRRLFITTQTGEIRIVQNGLLVPPAFASVSPVLYGPELGLLGIAFDPDFIDNGFVYVFVTVSSSEQQIVRFRAEDNLGVEPTVIVPGLPTGGVNHNGGALAFGPDGKLYWAIGDNGTELGTGSDLLVLASKIGRANPDGSVPSDNPFADGDGPNNDYIWARGFRNPFTMTFQPATGRLWLNVVGTRYEQVFTPQAGDNAGWADFESNQPAGYVPPVISYATGVAVSHAIAAGGIQRQGGKTTVNTTDEHRLRPGAQVTIAGALDATFNGSYYVSEVPTPTQFSVAQVGPDAVSGSGTATSQNIGNCVTGGTFWDSSAVPAAYQGNFFFGDFGTGRLMRARLDAQNRVISVWEFASGIVHYIDMDVGPDGSLYYLNQTGVLYHATYLAASQGLVVSRKNLRLQEGGTGAFHVRLAIAPAAAQSVTVSITGDSDVTLKGPTTLTFLPENWGIAQPVLVKSAVDADALDDTAQVRVSSNGIADQDVIVRVTDTQSDDTSAAGGASGAGSGGEPGGWHSAAQGGHRFGDPALGQGGQQGTTNEGGQAGPGSDAGGQVGRSSDDAAGGKNDGGAAGPDPSAATDSGCGCAVPGTKRSNSFGSFALALAFVLARRTRAIRSPRRHA